MADLVIRPTIKFIKLGYTTVFVLVALVLALASNGVAGVPLWAAGAAAVLLLWPAARQLRRQSTRITISGDKLRYQSGFVSRTTRTIQLSKIQDVRVDQTLIQRLLGIGTLSIETAGETSRLSVENLDDPQTIADDIVEAAHPSGGAHGGGRPAR